MSTGNMDSKKAIEEFNSIISKDTQKTRKTLKIIKNEYHKKNIMLGENILPIFLTANFISKEDYSKIKDCSERMAGILEKIAKGFFREKQFQDIFLISEDEKKLFEIDHGYTDTNILCRHDLLFDGDNIKFLEFNSESPAGIGRLPLLEEIFLDTDQFREFSSKYKISQNKDLRKSLLDAILKAYDEFDKGNNSKPRIALVDWEKVCTISDQMHVADYFISQGYDALLCAPSDLRYIDNKLYLWNKQIDIVYKRALTSELIEKKEKCADLLDAIKDKKVCLVNPFKSNILGDKKILHHLSNGDFNKILDEDEIDLIDKTIPWTRTISKNTQTDHKGKQINLEEFILNNKNLLVLKPSRGFGGNNILIGSEVDEKLWEKAVKDAFLVTDWIVQEYISIPTIDVLNLDGDMSFQKKYINVSPYIIGQKMCGILTRVSNSKVINTCAGGGIIPSFVVTLK